MTDEPRGAISIFLPSLEGGGAENVMITLANAIAARGHAVDLVLASARGRFMDEVGPGVRIVDLGRSRVMTCILPLRDYLRRESPIALLSALSHANVVALLARRLSGWRGRMVISERTSFLSVRRYARTPRNRIMRGLMRVTYPWADAVTVVSEPIIAELAEGLRLDARRIYYVPNPIVSDRLRSLAEEVPDHPWLADKGLPVVLGVGRLSPEKGFDVLIGAFARLRESRAARLVLLGEGQERAALERLVDRLGVGDSVALPGFAANPFAAMRRADVFVLPSRFEGMPGALIQAMACGTPVVSSDCHSGPRAVLEDGKWGALVPVEDELALARAIAQVLDAGEHPPVADRAALFDEERAVDRYLEIMGVASRRDPVPGGARSD
ncbi:MAG: glycosyltransferase [Sphingomonas sp.]|nr:glycosyltransferase [Sphingomonas sp.]